MRRLARRVSTFDGADLFIEISDLESIQELRGVKDDYLPANGFDVLHASMMSSDPTPRTLSQSSQSRWRALLASATKPTTKILRRIDCEAFAERQTESKGERALFFLFLFLVVPFQPFFPRLARPTPSPYPLSLLSAGMSTNVSFAACRGRRGQGRSNAPWRATGDDRD